MTPTLAPMQESVPWLLGVAERGLQRGLQVDLLGLSSIPSLTVLPQRLDALVLLMAIPVGMTKDQLTSRLIAREHDNPSNSAHTDLAVRAKGKLGQGESPGLEEFVSDPPRTLSGPLTEHSYTTPLRALGISNASHVLLPMPFPPLVLWKPCRVDVLWEQDGSEVLLGEVPFGFLVSPPISEEERRALLADPTRVRTLECTFECRKCNSRLKLFETLELNPADAGPLSPDEIRLSACDDIWTCSCSALTVDLQWLKRSVPFMFRNGHAPVASSEISLAGQYQQNRLLAIVVNYRTLLSTRPEEEAVQKYLEANSIFWNFLSPLKILFKPRILTHHTADFAVLSTQRILHLIEIEKPSTKLTRNDGGMSAEVQKAFDQVADWRRVVQKDLRSLLSELRLSESAVQSVRYVVVAGSEVAGATRIRQGLPDDTTFLTFEEIAAYLVVMQSQLARL